MSDLQPTRTGLHREAREFDKTQLRANNHGRTVHRDYAAHYFRWVTVKDALDTLHTDNVLDIGCGQDQPLVWILRASNKWPRAYVGVDLNPIPNPQSPAWATTLDEFNFIERWHELRRRGPFTVITCFEVVEHMMPPNALKLLKAAHELLDKRGTFFLSTPVFDGKAALNHLHEFTIPELQALIEKAGLRVAARYGTFGNVKQLEKVLTPEERILWDRWRWRLGNDGLSVVFATDHPDQCRNNLWLLRRDKSFTAEFGGKGFPDRLAKAHLERVKGAKESPSGTSPARRSAPAPRIPHTSPPARSRASRDARNVLIINGYAGSLTIAATQAGARVLGALENDGYGLNVQRDNFPDLPLFPTEKDWPKDSLTDTVVLAHPPCAGFCVQNNNSMSRAETRGVRGKHFEKTKTALAYALPLKPLAMLVESVTGAYEPTRPFYDALARRYGYHVYRVLQNAVTFGVPQWRPRFWSVLVRKDVAPELFVLQHDFNYVSIDEALKNVGRDTPIPAVGRYVDLVLDTMRGAKLDVDAYLSGEHGFGNLHVIAHRTGLIEGYDKVLLKKYFNITFTSQIPVVLNPIGFAPTIMRTAMLMRNGRPLGQRGYNAVSGYPLDYKIPLGTRSSLEGLEYRSRGVAPPVAKWLLEQTWANLGLVKRGPLTVNMTSVQALRPGETANFLVKRGDFKQRRIPVEQAVPAPVKRLPKPARAPKAAARYHAIRPADDYAKTLLDPKTVTHNAVVYRLLKRPMTFDELYSAAISSGWKSSSPNPQTILKWHVHHLLHERKLLEIQGEK